MNVQPDDLADRIERGTAPVIVDVRSAPEFASSHVPGARHVPLPSILSGRAEIPARYDQAIVLYCGHGPRAQLARLALRLRGYQRLQLLQGHMAGWQRRGLRTER